MVTRFTGSLQAAEFSDQKCHPLVLFRSPCFENITLFARINKRQWTSLNQSRSFSVRLNQSTKRMNCSLNQSRSFSVRLNQSTKRMNCSLNQSRSFSVRLNQSTKRMKCSLNQSRSFSVRLNQSTKRATCLLVQFPLVHSKENSQGLFRYIKKSERLSGGVKSCFSFTVRTGASAVLVRFKLQLFSLPLES